MREKQMMNFAYMERAKNNAGFTFISLLITLIIIFTTLPLLVQLTKTVSYRTNYNELSIQQFYHYLRDDLIEATAFQVSEHSLELLLQDDNTARSEEHTSELQSRGHLVCRLLLDK